MVRINGQDTAHATQAVMAWYLGGLGGLISETADTLELELRRNDVLWESYRKKDPAAANEVPPRMSHADEPYTDGSCTSAVPAAANAGEIGVGPSGAESSSA